MCVDYVAPMESPIGLVTEQLPSSNHVFSSFLTQHTWVVHYTWKSTHGSTAPIMIVVFEYSNDNILSNSRQCARARDDFKGQSK